MLASSLHNLSPQNARAVSNLLETHTPIHTQWMSPYSLTLWLYRIMASISGGQMPFPMIQAWQNGDQVLGVSLMQSDPFMTFRRYLIDFTLDPALENPHAIEIDFLDALFQFTQRRGVKFIVSELSPLRTDRMNLLKHQGFQLALQDHYFYLKTSFIQDAVLLPSTGETALRQAGYKRLMPSHYKVVCEHYNQQLPLIWKQALGKLPQHFKPTPHTERWWLASEENEAHCRILVEIKAPVESHPHVWQVWILPPSHQVVNLASILGLFEGYIRSQDAHAILRLQVSHTQTLFKEDLLHYAEEATEELRLCFIKELKARPRSGVPLHVAPPFLNLDGASPAYGMSSKG